MRIAVKIGNSRIPFRSRKQIVRFCQGDPAPAQRSMSNT
jgi:hypothetical protein